MGFADLFAHPLPLLRSHHLLARAIAAFGLRSRSHAAPMSGELRCSDAVADLAPFLRLEAAPDVGTLFGGQ
jgi:hypothetical protein